MSISSVPICHHLPKTVSASWWIASGRAACAKRTPPSTDGLKEVAPSTELRRWFGHDPSRWEEFRHRYGAELSHNTALVSELRTIAQKGRLTLVYAARDELHNEAVVLRDVLMH